MKLNLDIAKEIIRLGTEKNGDLTDPSESVILKDAGVAPVTAHIEKLSLTGLVKDAQPIFGKNGGMWIGFGLSKEGLACGKDNILLEKTLESLFEKPINEVSKSVYDLIETCKQQQIRANYKDDFIRSLEEIAICFQNDCYIATITLCGKILEICLTDVLQSNGIDTTNIRMIGNMIKAIRNNISTQYLDPSLNSVADIISKSRNTAVHYNEKIPIPSRDQAIMVIFATRDVVNRHLTRWTKKMPPTLVYRK